MNTTRYPLYLGAIGGLATALVALYPIIWVREVGWIVIRLYFSAGFGGVWAICLIAGALGGLYVAALDGRISTTRAASYGLGGGMVVVLVAIVWALSIDEQTIFEFPIRELIEYHRWMVVGLSSVIPIASIWLARRTGAL